VSGVRYRWTSLVTIKKILEKRKFTGCVAEIFPGPLIRIRDICHPSNRWSLQGMFAAVHRYLRSSRWRWMRRSVAFSAAPSLRLAAWRRRYRSSGKFLAERRTKKNQAEDSGTVPRCEMPQMYCLRNVNSALWVSASAYAGLECDEIGIEKKISLCTVSFVFRILWICVWYVVMWDKKNFYSAGIDVGCAHFPIRPPMAMKHECRRFSRRIAYASLYGMIRNSLPDGLCTQNGLNLRKIAGCLVLYYWFVKMNKK
jgi:hypothetical protein